MGRTSKPKGKTKTTKRQRIKELSPKDSKRVKGGAGDFSFTPKINKASPSL